MKHEISVLDRVINITLNDTIVQNGINSDVLSVILDNEWKELDSIKVIFTNGNKSIIKVLNSTFSVDIPWEVLKDDGKLYVSVVGYIGSTVKVITEKMKRPFKVSISGKDTGSNAANPTPNEIQQLMSEHGRLRQDIENKVNRNELTNGINLLGETEYKNLAVISPNVLKPGDTYYVTDKFCNYTWNGKIWFQSSAIIENSSKYVKSVNNKTPDTNGNVTIAKSNIIDIMGYVPVKSINGITPVDDSGVVIIDLGVDGDEYKKAVPIADRTIISCDCSMISNGELTIVTDTFSLDITSCLIIESVSMGSGIMSDSYETNRDWTVTVKNSNSTITNVFSVKSDNVSKLLKNFESFDSYEDVITVSFYEDYKGNINMCFDNEVPGYFNGGTINDLDYSTNTTWSSQHINEIRPKKFREEVEATCFKVEDKKDIHITVPNKAWLSNNNMIRITSYSSSLSSVLLENTFGLNIYVYVEGESTFYTNCYIAKNDISALVSFPITKVNNIMRLGIYKGEDDNFYMTYDKIRDYTATNVQPDWNVENTSSDAYIKNKPVIPEAVTEATTSKAGLIPALSGNSAQFLNGNGEWAIPETRALSTYGESVQVSRTCFKITPDMVDSDRSYTDYEDMGNGSSTAPTLYLYLKGNYTFNKNKQYLYLDFPVDVINTSNSPTMNSSNEADITIYNADGSFMVDDLTVTGLSNEYESEYDFVNTVSYYYYYYQNGSWNHESDTRVVEALTYTDKSEKGYLYQDSEGGYIDFLLSCANNNNALSMRMYKFGVSTNPYAGIEQNISLKENTKYKFSACVDIISGTVTHIGFVLSDTTGTNQVFSGELPITNGKVSYEFTTGSDLTNFKRCYVYNGKTNQTTSRQVLLYNMMIKEI